MSLPASDQNAVADQRITMQLGDVLPKTAEVKDGHLYIGGVDMVQLAREQGTALYVFDEEDLRDRIAQYRDDLAAAYPNSEVIYASKAFLNKAMARIAAEEGISLDVSGGGELAIALAAGFPASRVYVHGNNKTEVELAEAIDAGVGRIMLDSRIELERVNRLAGERGVVQDVYMRITPGVEADTHEYIKTGCEDSKFGFTMREDWAFNCVEDVLAAPNVRLAGVHMHIGSQIFALHSFDEAIEVAIDLFARIRERYNHVIEELDIGGGVGVAYMVDDKPCTIAEFAQLAADSVRKHCAAHDFPEPRILCEPGRSSAAPAGVTL